MSMNRLTKLTICFFSILAISVGAIFVSEKSVASECQKTDIGESYELVKKKKNFRFLTSLSEIKDNNEIWVSNIIISTVFCEIKFNQKKNVVNTKLVYI